MLLSGGEIGVWGSNLKHEAQINLYSIENLKIT